MSALAPKIIGGFTIARRAEDMIREAYLAKSPDGEEVVLALFDLEQPARRELLAEMERCKRLKHRAAVRIIKAFEADGRCAVAFEHHPGVTLATLAAHLRAEGEPLTQGASLYIIKEVLDVLAEAHRLAGAPGTSGPLVHQQLGPEQVLITWDAGVKVFGLGMSSAYRAERKQMAWPAEILPYVPPEVRDGAEPKPLSNLYSAAAILWALLAHEEPPSDGSPVAPLAERCAGVDEDLAQGVDRALAPNPSTRFLAARLLAQSVDSRVTDSDKEELRWNMEVLRAVLAIDTLACAAGMPVSYLTKETAGRLDTMPPDGGRSVRSPPKIDRAAVPSLKSPALPRVVAPRPSPSSPGSASPTPGRAVSVASQPPPLPAASDAPLGSDDPDEELTDQHVRPQGLGRSPALGSAADSAATFSPIPEVPSDPFAAAGSDAPVGSAPPAASSSPPSSAPFAAGRGSPLPPDSLPPGRLPPDTLPPDDGSLDPTPTAPPVAPRDVAAPAAGYSTRAVAQVAAVVAVVALGVGVLVGRATVTAEPAPVVAPKTSAAAPVATAKPKPTASVVVAPPAAAPPTAAPSAATSASPAASVAEADDPAALPEDYGYLIVEPASEGVGVYETGKYVGPTGSRIRMKCGTRFIRLGTHPFGSWLGDGRGVNVACRAVSKATFEAKEP